MDSISIGLEYKPFDQEQSRTKASKSYKINHKNTISYNRLKSYLGNIHSDSEQLRTGDRFIPLKNDNNFQNFVLKTPNPSNMGNLENTKINEQNLLSPLDEKPETNYASFIVDNMLRINIDQYNFPRSKIVKLRNNSIYTFSKKISINSINTSSNNNTQQKDNNLFNENLKLNNLNNKSINSINSSNELLRTKNKNHKSITRNELHMSSSLLNNPQFPNANQSFQFNSILNENMGDLPNTDSLFQYIDASSNKRSVLPDTDYLLSNYSNNNTFKRKINLSPERILDAPNLVDDYYLNLLEWGRVNLLAVALGSEIYLWNGESLETSLLMSTITDNNQILENNSNNITSLSWMNNGICLGIGLPNGNIELWDVIKGSRIRDIKAHSDRVSCLAWNNYNISSGSKDKSIKSFDVRSREGEIWKIRQHKQEVCALKYSPEGDLLSSGGNDNVSYIWDVRKLNNKLLNISNLNCINDNDCNTIKPYSVNNYHTAAVKAMAWCPWQRHILATGGGTKDKTIKVFNCDSNKIIKNVETGSQVCALLWNKKEREIISSHGFNKNQITIWNYQKMRKICELKGHMSRVLYLTMSPDENFICSGSGDETLRFWKINDGIKEVQNEEDPLMSNIIVR
jgi:WD40 repeat protein